MSVGILRHFSFVSLYKVKNDTTYCVLCALKSYARREQTGARGEGEDSDAGSLYDDIGTAACVQVVQGCATNTVHCVARVALVRPGKARLANNQ